MHLLSVLPLLVITTHASSASFKSKCEAFVSDYQKHSPKNIAVNIAQYLPSNANITHVNDGYDARCVSVGSPPLPVPICRLSLNVTTSPSSMTVMEAWLPENWTGRFLSVGNGGFGGCVQYVDMAYSTSFGFASVGTNNGHNDILDKDFFNAPEVLRDFTWRALYTGVVVGKDLTKEFYGKPHTKSYYFGCSQGGRQGFKAVQDHPELFDGVIAGAPYINGNQQLAFWGYAYTVLGKEGSKTWLSIEQWSLYHNETLRQCDGQDGARDGILDNTRACKPDYTRLLCSGYATKDCLTRTQLDAANKLYAPWYLNGTLVHDGNQHGNELATITDLLFANGSIVPSWVTEWLAYVVYSDTSYLQRPVATYTEKELGDLARADPLNFNTFNGDISRFRDRGGKVLHWHGQADPNLSIFVSDRYYAHVAKTLDSSPEKLDDFYRYFRISGLGHCIGGPGTNAFGQFYGLNASNAANDNILTRIVEWVEHKKAPEVVRSTKFINDDPTKGVDYARNNCKYPKVNKYKGTGNGKDEAGWHCV